MLTQNMGRLDRTLRLLVGVSLMPVGLWVLGGSQGSLTGIVVGAFAAMFTVTGLIGFCPAYLPFGVSTVARRRDGA